MHRNTLCCLAAILVLVAAVTVTPVSAGTTSPPVTSVLFAGRGTVPLPGSVSPLLRHAHRLQPVPNSRQIGISVSLRIRDETSLNQFLADVYNPASPSYRHFLSRPQFVQRFGPAAATRSGVIAWLKGQGLSVTGISRNGMQITARGSTSSMRRAFQTPVYSFRADGQSFIANTRPIHLPASLADDVLAVSGLSTDVREQPVARPRHESQGPYGGFSPSDLNQLYDLTPLKNQGINGSGQTVAIMTFGDYTESDISTYDQQYNLPQNLTRVNVSDGHTSGSSTGSSNGQDETEGDIESVQAIAPASNILVYEAPNDSQGGVNLYNQVVSDDRAKVVSTSWGDVETHWPRTVLNAMHQALMEGAAQGQAFFVPSGDAGAYDGAGEISGGTTTLAVDYPASDPWVTAVGGTTVQANGSQYVGETVWTDTSHSPRAGSGGGLSSIYKIPSYQTGPGVSNRYSNGMRQVPDVALVADPQSGPAIYTVDSGNNPTWEYGGGTSISAPLWAAFAALVNQAIGRPVGFMNPLLYDLGQQAPTFAQSPFHDVTQGNNLFYPATPGWDFATGWGSFDGAAFVAAVRSLPALPTVPPLPTATPRPTAGTVSVGIQQVLLLHKVRGKLTQTARIKVGESGRLVILYQSQNAGNLHAGGSVSIRQRGKVVGKASLWTTTYEGKLALAANVRFTSKKRVGTLSAHITVKLGTASAALNRSFRLVYS